MEKSSASLTGPTAVLSPVPIPAPIPRREAWLVARLADADQRFCLLPCSNPPCNPCQLPVAYGRIPRLNPTGYELRVWHTRREGDEKAQSQMVPLRLAILYEYSMTIHPAPEVSVGRDLPTSSFEFADGSKAKYFMACPPSSALRLILHVANPFCFFIFLPIVSPPVINLIYQIHSDIAPLETLWRQYIRLSIRLFLRFSPCYNTVRSLTCRLLSVP